MNKFILLLSLVISNISWAEASTNEENIKYIIVARHGQTDYNAKKLLTGRGSNPNLNEDGIQQALELGKKLAKEFSGESQIELIVSSDMNRTNQTTDIVNKFFSLPVVYNTKLQEVNRGGLEGKPLVEVIPIINALPDDQAHPVHGGESTAQFRQRVTEGICEYFYAPEQVILVIAHGYVGEAASHHFKEESIKLGNTDYVIFNYDDLKNKCTKKMASNK